MKKQINEIIKLLKTSNYDYKYDAIEQLQDNREYINLDDDVLLDVVNIIIKNNLIFTDSINNAEELYKKIVLNKNDEKEYNYFLKVFESYNNTDYDEIEINKLTNLFSNENNLMYVLDLFKEIYEIEKFHDYYGFTKDIYNYIITSRRYYVDEQAFLSSLTSLFNKIKERWDKNIDDEIDNIIYSHINEDKKVAGIYDIPENELKLLPNRITKLKDEITEIEKRQLSINNTLNKIEESFNNKVEFLDNKTKTILEEIKMYASDLENTILNIKQDTLLNNNNESNNKLDLVLEKLQIYSNEEIEFDNFNMLDINNELKKLVNLNYEKIKEKYHNNEIVISYENQIKEKIEDIIILEKCNKLSDLQIDKLYLYFVAYHNGNLDIFKALTDDMEKNIDKYYPYLFEYDFTNKFENKENLIQFIKVSDIHKIVRLYNWYTINDGKLDQIIRLFEINSNFPFNEFTDSKLCNAINIFGLDQIAHAGTTMTNNLIHLNEEQYDTYKKLLEINPDFEIFDSALIYENEIFSLDELGKLSLEQQKKLYVLMYGPINYPKNIEYKNQIRDIVYSELSYNNISDCATTLLEILKDNDLRVYQYINFHEELVLNYRKLNYYKTYSTDGRTIKQFFEENNTKNNIKRLVKNAKKIKSGDLQIRK